MQTKPSNAVCAHDFTPSLEEAGVEVCAWGCGEMREAPAELDDAVRVVCVAVEARRAA